MIPNLPADIWLDTKMEVTERKLGLRDRLAKKKKLLDDARASLQVRVASDPPSPAFDNLSALEIQVKLQKNEMTALEALRVYQKKIIDTLDCHAICDVIVDAEEAAKSIDPKCTSPIRGLPVSIKENIAIAGYDSTIGLVSRALKPQKEDSPLILALRSAGAVPFVTTTMSPTGLCMDASTDMFGKQRNPHDSKRLAGGSSSGEAILIAKGASPLGFGTDSGGSLRIPAAFCGTCSFKPTSSRVSSIGLGSASEAEWIVLKPAMGPMAMHTSLLSDGLRAILNSTMFSLDPRVARIPFREDVFSSTKPLVIGFYSDLGGDVAVKAVPSVERAVSEAKAVLEAKGHKVVNFNVPDPSKLTRLALTGMFIDGGAGFLKASQNDPTNERFRQTRSIIGIPSALKRVGSKIISGTYSSALGQVAYYFTGCQTAAEVFKTMAEVGEYQAEFAKKWASAKLDVLLCPVLPFPSPLETTPDPMLSGGVVYVSMYNMLDYPSGVVTVGKVSESDVAAAQSRVAEYRKAGDTMNASHAEWQSETKGLPVAVQVVGRPLDEETVLRVMTEIQDGCSNK